MWLNDSMIKTIYMTMLITLVHYKIAPKTKKKILIKFDKGYN